MIRQLYDKDGCYELTRFIVADHRDGPTFVLGYGLSPIYHKSITWTNTIMPQMNLQ